MTPSFVQSQLHLKLTFLHSHINIYTPGYLIVSTVKKTRYKSYVHVYSTQHVYYSLLFDSHSDACDFHPNFDEGFVEITYIVMLSHHPSGQSIFLIS